MCDCPKDCLQKFPSQKRTIHLSTDFLNTPGSKLRLQLPFCVNECASNCNLSFTDFHFVAVCVKDHCRTCFTDVNDPECNGGELSDNAARLLSLRQLPGTRVTLSRVGIELERNAEGEDGLWAALAAKFMAPSATAWKQPLALCIEYWVECADCCTAPEETIPPPPTVA